MAHNILWVARFLVRQRPQFWMDLGRALLELAVARIRLGFWKNRWTRTLAQLGSRSEPSLDVFGCQLALVERIAVAVPRVAARLPWRADCLVQALAAQSWLEAAQIKSTLSIGVRQQSGSGFEAHAWLMVGSLLVTGGDIAGFDPLPVRRAST